MPNPSVGIMAGSTLVGAAGSRSAGRSAERAAERSAEASIMSAEAAEALNRERYAEAQQMLSPYMQGELAGYNQLLAEMGLAPVQPINVYQGGTAAGLGRPTPPPEPEPVAEGYLVAGKSPRTRYVIPQSAKDQYERDYAQYERDLAEYETALMQTPTAPQAVSGEYIPADRTPAYQQTPGYQQMMSAMGDLQQEQLEAVNQGAAGSGMLYSGRRGEELAQVGADTALKRAGIESDFYSNYMNLLQNIANPTATRDIASLGMGQAATTSKQNIAAQSAASQALMQGAQAKGAATADIASGLMNLGGSLVQGGYLNSGGGSTGGGGGAYMPSGQQMLANAQAMGSTYSNF